MPRSLVLPALGLLLMASGAANAHALAAPVRGDDWSLFAVAEIELYGGFWLLCGLFPRRARTTALVAFLAVFAYDVAHVAVGRPLRCSFGRVVSASGLVLWCVRKALSFSSVERY